jgi:trigger factor
MTATATTLERLSPARARCVLTFEPEQIKAAEERALVRLGERVNIEGFRPGKAPADMVKSRINPEVLFEEAIRELLNTALPTIMTEHGLRPIIAPRVETVTREPLQIRITFVERPVATMKKLDSLHVKKNEPKVEQKEIDRVLKSLLQDHRTFKEVEEAAKSGHQLTVAFHGTDAEGKEIPGMKTDSYPVLLGEGSLLPGFEDQLMGLKKGDEKKFTLTMPATYQVEELRGKPVEFHVKATKVEHVDLPELTDALAKEAFRVDSAADLKDRIVKSLTEQEEQAERIRRERELLDEIGNHTEVDLPPELVEEEVRGFLEETEERLKSQGLTFADWMKQTKKTPKDLEDDWKKQAERRLKLRFGLAAIIEQKKITVSDEEMKDVLTGLLGSVPDDQRETVKAAHQPGSDGYEELRWRESVEKAMRSFLD